VKIIKNKKYAQIKLNPLDGKSKAQALRIVNRQIIPNESIQGYFSDDAWQPIHEIWDAFNNAGLSWGITDSKYYPYENNPMGGKKWTAEINFTNNKGVPTKIYVYVTAAGAGTVEDPLSRYDVTAYAG
jgi:hypothetical protein